MYVRTYVPGNQFNLKLDLPLAYYCTWLQIYILCLHPSTGPLPLIKSINWTPPLYFTLQLYPSLLMHPSIAPLPFISPFNWTPPFYYTLQLEPSPYALQLDPSPLLHPSIGPLPLQAFKSSVYGKIAALPPILISSIFHEYIIAVGLKFFFPVLTFQFFCLGGVCMRMSCGT